jgi:hypothetical protein
MRREADADKIGWGAIGESVAETALVTTSLFGLDFSSADWGCQRESWHRKKIFFDSSRCGSLWRRGLAERCGKTEIISDLPIQSPAAYRVAAR